MSLSANIYQRLCFVVGLRIRDCALQLKNWPMYIDEIWYKPFTPKLWLWMYAFDAKLIFKIYSLCRIIKPFAITLKMWHIPQYKEQLPYY